MEYLAVFILGCLLTYFGLRPELKRLDDHCKELRERENFRIGYRPILPAIKDAQIVAIKPQSTSDDSFPDLYERQKAARE